MAGDNAFAFSAAIRASESLPLIAGVDITKGADASSFGNAGSVAMRTVGADDIVKDGEKWGLKVKGGFGTNLPIATKSCRARLSATRLYSAAARPQLHGTPFRVSADER